MQRILNNPDDIVDEMLKGFVKTHCDIVKTTEHPRVLAAKAAPVQGKVGVMTGGGSGHKPAFIRAHIASRHHGADPVLVGGDSMGDYGMLTEFKGLQAALVFPRDLGQRKMDELIASAPASGGKVLVQGRDEPHGRFRPNHSSVYPPPGRP